MYGEEEVNEIAVDCARNVLGLQHVPGASEAGRDMNLLRERLFMPLGGMGMISSGSKPASGIFCCRISGGGGSMVTLDRMLP